MKSTTSSPISPKNQQRSSKSNTSLLRPSQIVNTSKVSLRSRHENTNRGDSHRLSVPNLADCMQSGASASRGVAATAKALTSKLGRNPGTGELQVGIRMKACVG
ncbi:hypothetical protein AB6A40_011412 [Gnathostoma spinigerum]|uniref:Uncharacterized protein n=1 Tax=Gnathostoma spinigerum TaxID=75299 RepID=A0ABD6F3H0_9BILA